MEREEVIEKSPLFTAVRPVQFVQVVVIGLFAGAFSWIFAAVIGMYMLKPANCTDDAFACAVSSQPAVILAAVLAALIGLFGLVKLQVFRPLLVVIAATLSVWGLADLLGTLPWHQALALSVGLHAVAYATFMWIARIRVFWLAVLVCVVLVVLLRLIITA